MKKLVCRDNDRLLSEFVSNAAGLGYFKTKKLIDGGEIKVNGIRTKNDVRLEAGDEVVVYVADKPTFETVYADQNVLFVYKPAGIEVLGQNSLQTAIGATEEGADAKAVNRIDRNTTGIVCFAKTQQSLAELEDCFKNRQVQKYYEALVYGVPKHRQADLKAFLFKDAKESLVYISDTQKKGYMPIETIYRVTETYDGFCRLLIELVTGRTHQIRAHMAHIGHPILGDGKYGTNEINRRFGFKTQALCAVEYKFKLPSTSFLSYLNDVKISVKAPF